MSDERPGICVNCPEWPECGGATQDECQELLSFEQEYDYADDEPDHEEGWD